MFADVVKLQSQQRRSAIEIKKPKSELEKQERGRAFQQVSNRTFITETLQILLEQSPLKISVYFSSIIHWVLFS